MRKNLNLRAYIALGLVFAFFVNSIAILPSAQAEEFYLPAPGSMVPLSPGFTPAVLKGIKLDPTDPFKFHFFVDRGDSNLAQEQLKQESAKLIKYFLASLTIPEKDRIIPPIFGQTEMGRDLLAEDYLLKQITASLIYPESQLGKEFWQKVYAQAQAKYGTTNIPINTFNKVWIIPEKAVVYENGGVAFVLENHLKVMLEQDYLSLQKHTETVILSATKDLKAPKDSSATPQNDVNALGSQIVREIVIPALTKEVNEGKNFSQLRQVFYSLILATWYKKKIKDSILNKVYSNRNKIQNLSSPNTSVGDPEHIYQQYLQAFKKGVYNYIKEEYDPSAQQNIPRKYFSGGVNALGEDRAMIVVGPAQVNSGEIKNLKIEEIQGSFAMITGATAPTGNDRKIGFDRLAGAYPGLRPSELRTRGDPEDIDGTLQIGSAEVASHLTWISKPASHDPFIPQHVIELRKLTDTLFPYKPNSLIPFDVFVSPLSDVETWDDPDVTQQKYYRGYIFLAFDKKGRLIKPEQGWRLFGPASIRSGVEWSFNFIDRQLDSLVGKPFEMASLNDTENFNALASVPMRLRIRHPLSIKESGLINDIPYTIRWKNYSGKPFSGNEDKRNDILGRIMKFIGSPEAYSMVTGGLGIDLPYQDLRRIDIQYLRFSQRVVLVIRLWHNNNALYPDPVSLIAKRGYGDEKNASAFKALKGTGLVPEFAAQIDGVYYEELINGKSVASICENRGLNSDEIRDLAASWISIGNRLAQADVRNPFAMDMNPGNIVKKNTRGKGTGFVVVDIYGSHKSPSNQKAYFIREFYEHYISGKNLKHLPQATHPVQAMLEGVAQGFNNDEARINSFLGQALAASPKEISPILHQEVTNFLERQEESKLNAAMIITKGIPPSHQIGVDGDALIREGMQYAYKKTVEKYGKRFGWTNNNVYRKGACKFVVGFLNNWLSMQGIRTTVVTYIGYSLEDFHYVIFVRQGRDALLIDPTWQQYLKREDVKGRLPKTLIARVESLRERLYAYGVKKGAIEIIYKGLIRRYYQYYTQDKIFYRRSMAQFNPVQLMANGERAMGNHAMKSERPVIYIVDDSLTMLSEWRRMIRDLQDDYHFLIFSSPQDALAHLAQAKPAFIITDTVMPGMDGPHFTLAARKLLKQQVPVLAVSEEMKSLSAWENVPRYNFITKSELRRKDHKIIDIVHKILPVNRRASARRSAHVAAASSNETDTVESYDDIAKGIVAALQTKKLWNDDPRRGGPEETKRRIKVLLQKMGYTSPFVINCLKIVELPSGIGYTIGLKLEVKIRLSGVMELGKILKGKAILIFDDNPISARAFKAVFKSQGAYIKVVNRRGEFEELLDREGKGYDMFIVHMGYRGGKVDTSYLWDKVKKEYPDKKFLAVTGAILEPLVGGVEGLNLFPKQYVLYGNPLLVHNLLLDSSSNGAMITHRDGGIDFDPAQMSMQVKGAEEDFKFDFNGTQIDAAQITGATFTIRTMTPVTDLPLVLGLNK